MLRVEGVNPGFDSKDSGEPSRREAGMGSEEAGGAAQDRPPASATSPRAPQPGSKDGPMDGASRSSATAAPTMSSSLLKSGGTPLPPPLPSSVPASGYVWSGINAGGRGAGTEYQGPATAGAERKRRKPASGGASGGGGGSGGVSGEDGEGSRVKWMRHKTRALLKEPAGNPDLARGLPRRLADSPLDWVTAESTLQRWAAARGFRTAVFRTSDPQHKQLACTKAGKHREDNRTRNKRPHPDSNNTINHHHNNNSNYAAESSSSSVVPAAPSSSATGSVVTQKCDCPWMIKCVSVSEPIEGVVGLPGIYIVKYPDADHNHDLLPPAPSPLVALAQASLPRIPAPALLPPITTTSTTYPHQQQQLLPRPSSSATAAAPRPQWAVSSSGMGTSAGSSSAASGNSSPVPLSSASLADAHRLLLLPPSSSSSPRPLTSAALRAAGPGSPGSSQGSGTLNSPTPPHANNGSSSAAGFKAGGAVAESSSSLVVGRPPSPPHRISFMTFNVWKDDSGQPASWPARRGSFMDTLVRLNPDVLCIQEAHPELVDHILAALPYHHHVVRREEETRGWELESNIFWRSTLFQEVEHGTEALGYSSLYPYRHLFWVKLRPRPQPGVELEGGGRTFLVATAHYPWRGNATELSTGENLRIGAAKRTAAHLRRFAQHDPSMPIFFMGDLNESFHPIRILREGGLVEDCFTALGLPITPTHPIRPTAPQEDALPDECLDWIVASPHARPVLAAVMRPAAVSVPPSDHCPVMAVYELSLLNTHTTAQHHHALPHPPLHHHPLQRQQQQQLPVSSTTVEDEDEEEVGYGASGLLHLLGPSRRRSHEAPY